MKDYSKRANVIKYLPWWLKKIAAGEMTKESAIALLKSGKTIRFINAKDCKGLVQALEG